MNISVIGSGYVGLVAAACFAEMGNKVITVDIDEQKVKNLRQGIIPIYEPGLESLVLENYKKERLIFTTKLNEALTKSRNCSSNIPRVFPKISIINHVLSNLQKAK